MIHQRPILMVVHCSLTNTKVLCGIHYLPLTVYDRSILTNNSPMKNTSTLFEPIDHNSVSDAVIAQIERLIVSGVLKEGRKLPPEREMAQLLDVSRPKLREALKKLEERELIQVLHGDGTFVAPLIGKALSPALIELYSRHTDAFLDYLEYRREQEAFAAKLAADRATKADLDIINGLLDEMSLALKAENHDQEMELDIKFHAAVVDASHNSTLIHMMGSIYELTRNGVFYNRNYLRSIENADESVMSQHRAIGEAICDRDPAAATLAAQQHMDFVGHSFTVFENKTRREKFAEKRKSLST